jgi:hypothetical protein
VGVLQRYRYAAFAPIEGTRAGWPIAESYSATERRLRWAFDWLFSSGRVSDCSRRSRLALLHGAWRRVQVASAKVKVV